ncbi:AlwI family type II restriction endonuclease [Flavobacterium sp.]|uniref:AlwI family type II restriction endonuclease n=1 Tax=Flavobacterium sp. TaxID=239 RepID=UPI00260C651F|nr:AlwI family type II restriction endonuclease [Flavobacterium sp.]
MAHLSKTRHLFAFTSPRTIEKIIPEIRLLSQNFEGKKWSNDIQSQFYEDLFASDFFEGESKAKNTAFAARDRITRAPKALGFIDLKPTIQLTEVGKQLVSEKRSYEVITKQLLKFQLPSPYHTDKQDLFFVKPYLEFLRLVKAVGSLSKTEIALFFLQITKVDKFDEVVAKINKFRVDRDAWKGNRKLFVENYFEKEIAEIFAEEIANNETETRESKDNSFANFVKTKKQNMGDYADAFIRYIRATQLITFQSKTYRVILAPSKIAEVDFILNNIERNPVLYKSEKEFKDYLFSATNIQLFNDNRELLIGKLQKLNITFDNNLTLEELKDLLEVSEENIKRLKLQETSLQLKNYKEFDDIIDVFGKIQKREVPDPPLYLEWNVWRAMTMINYAMSVTGNFTIDTDGVPLNTASGNKADIEIEYDTFKMIVEVTLSSGNTQFNMEGESVARHFGTMQNNTEKPVFCFFIAPKISDGALAHFFNLNRFKTKAYGGKTRIVPMSVTNFVDFITTAKNTNFSHSNTLYNYLDKVVKENQVADDEVIWFDNIKKSVESWTA